MFQKDKKIISKFKSFALPMPSAKDTGNVLLFGFSALAS